MISDDWEELVDIGNEVIDESGECNESGEDEYELNDWIWSRFQNLTVPSAE